MKSKKYFRFFVQNFFFSDRGIKNPKKNRLRMIWIFWGFEAVSVSLRPDPLSFKPQDFELKKFLSISFFLYYFEQENFRNKIFHFNVGFLFNYCKLKRKLFCKGKKYPSFWGLWVNEIFLYFLFYFVLTDILP